MIGRFLRYSLSLIFILYLFSFNVGNDLKFLSQDSLRLEIGDAPNLTPIEYDSLYDFYVALKGENWIFGPNEVRWDYNQPNPNPCAENWYGVSCSCNVTYCNLDVLELNRHNLTGPLLPSIENFMNLSMLLLHDNHISGSIPEEIGNLRSLTNMTLRVNFLTGNLPMSLWNMTQLIVLDLEINFLEGSLPDEIGQLTNVIWFNLQSNLFSGTLPSTIGNMKSLESLKLSINAFNGSLPLSLTTFPNLKNIYAYLNDFTSTIPAEISQIKTLRTLNIGINYFTGQIPDSIGQMMNLNYLGLLSNNLFGSIPSTFGSNLTQLVVLSLTDNLLSQNIPDSLSEIPYLIALFLTRNSLSGSIPLNFSQNFNHLEILAMNHNFFNETIPITFFDFNFTYSLLLDQNSFSGSLPDFIQMDNIATLTIDDNYFTGKLPNSMYETLNQVKSLQLYKNYFTSTISSNLNQLKYLEFFYAQNNLFTGSLQFTLQGFPILSEVFLFENYFTGNLNYLVNGNRNSSSSDVDQIPSILRVLDISENSLTGTIPGSLFTSYPNIEEFVSSINCFIGDIPNEICQATNLTVIEMDGLSSAKHCRVRIFENIPSFTAFYLKYYMKGTIPSCLFSSLPALTSLHLSGNGFTGSLPDVNVIPTLTDLVVSHNFLGGTLPENYQQHSWDYLDISYNKITGYLHTNAFNTVPLNDTVDLDENRFSGDIPHALLHIKNIDILAGNMWTCNYDRSNLPNNDPNEEIYQCGSDSVNQSFVIYVCIVFVGMIGVIIFELWKRINLFRHRSELLDLPTKMNDLPKAEAPVEKPSSSTSLVFIPDYWSVVRGVPNYSSLPFFPRLFIAFSDCKKTFFSILFTPIEKEEDDNIRSIVRLMINIRQSLLKCLFVILMILTPIYLGLSFHYSNYSKRYIWLFSSIFLSGKAAGALLFLTFVVMYLSIALIFYRHLLFKSNQFKKHSERNDSIDRLSLISNFYQTKQSFRLLLPYLKEIWKYLFSLRFKGLCCIFLINFIVMIFIDVCYVYIALNNSSEIIFLSELSLSLFRIYWNEIVLWKMMEFLKDSMYFYQQLQDEQDEKDEEELQRKQERERYQRTISGDQMKSKLTQMQRQRQGQGQYSFRPKSEKIKKQKTKKSLRYGESGITTNDLAFSRRSDVFQSSAAPPPLGASSSSSSLSQQPTDEDPTTPAKGGESSILDGRDMMSSSLTNSQMNLSYNSPPPHHPAPADHNHLQQLEDIPITKEIIFESEKDLIFLIYLLLFNNIAIPGLAAAIISKRCFYNAFFAAPDVTSSYDYYQCATVANINAIQAFQCNKYGLTENSITYTPPFSYSYECVSVVITKYAAVYVYMTLFAGIIIPSIRLLLAAVYRYYHFNSPDTFHGSFWDEVLLRGLTMPLIPVDLLLQASMTDEHHHHHVTAVEQEDHRNHPSDSLFREFSIINNPIHGFNRFVVDNKPQLPPTEAAEEGNSTRETTMKESTAIPANSLVPSLSSNSTSSLSRVSKRRKLPTIDGTLFNREKFIVKVTNYLAILITFGVVFPLLAVLLFVSIMLLTYYEQVVLTNFILNLKKLFRIRYSNAFRLHSKYIQHCFNRSLWILLSFATFIYAFLLFDTVGDVYGWRVGLGVSMGLVGWYLVIWLGFDWMWRNVLEKYFDVKEAKNKEVLDRSGSVTSEGGISLPSVDAENPK